MSDSGKIWELLLDTYINIPQRDPKEVTVASIVNFIIKKMNALHQHSTFHLRVSKHFSNTTALASPQLYGISVCRSVPMCGNWGIERLCDLQLHGLSEVDWIGTQTWIPVFPTIYYKKLVVLIIWPLSYLLSTQQIFFNLIQKSATDSTQAYVCTREPGEGEDMTVILKCQVAELAMHMGKKKTGRYYRLTRALLNYTLSLE